MFGRTLACARTAEAAVSTWCVAGATAGRMPALPSMLARSGFGLRLGRRWLNWWCRRRASPWRDSRGGCLYVVRCARGSRQDAGTTLDVGAVWLWPTAGAALAELVVRAPGFALAGQPRRLSLRGALRWRQPAGCRRYPRCWRGLALAYGWCGAGLNWWCRR